MDIAKSASPVSADAEYRVSTGDRHHSGQLANRCRVEIYCMGFFKGVPELGLGYLGRSIRKRRGIKPAELADFGYLRRFITPVAFQYH
jgi:hypothetical protein